MGHLIKVTNTTATNSTLNGATIPTGGSYYVQLGQGRVITNNTGEITFFAVNNGSGAPVAVTGWRVEVGRLLDNGRFSVHLSSAHGRT